MLTYTRCNKWEIEKQFSLKYTEDIISAETRELPNKLHTGESLSEALILSSDCSEQDKHMFSTCCVHKLLVFVLTFRTIYVGTQHILNLYFSSTELVIQ